MRTVKLFFAAFVFVGFEQLVHGQASAVMGSQTIMSRVDTDKDQKLSLSEARATAGERYDLIKKKNGGVTMLQLGGRITPDDLKVLGVTPSTRAPVSKDQYLSLVDRFFDEADTKRQKGDAPGSGKLDMDELGSIAGAKLIKLIQ